MLQLFRTAKRMVTPTASDAVVIKQIHDSFDTASDILLRDAEEYLKNNDIDRMDIWRAGSLEKAGFRKASIVQEVNTKIKESERVKKRYDVVNELRVKYPQYKVIFLDQVESICKKYGLLCADVDRYKGVVPDKNIKEIAAFKILPEDRIWENTHRGSWGARFYDSNYLKSVLNIDITTFEGGFIKKEDDSYGCLYLQPIPFKICAPVKDIIHDERERDGFFVRAVPDPIVLYPLSEETFLIVSKWGLEGSDPSLVNEIAN